MPIFRIELSKERPLIYDKQIFLNPDISLAVKGFFSYLACLWEEDEINIPKDISHLEFGNDNSFTELLFELQDEGFIQIVMERECEMRIVILKRIGW